MTVTPSSRVVTCMRCRDTGPGRASAAATCSRGRRRTRGRRRPRTARWTPGGRRAPPARCRPRRAPACSVKRGRASSSRVTGPAHTSAPGDRLTRTTRAAVVLGHRGHRGVIDVEDHHSGRRNSLGQFGFRRGDGLAGAELAEVGGADVEHHGDRRRRDRGQRGDVAGVARRHLQDQDSRCRVCRAQHRPRVAELVVERARAVRPPPPAGPAPRPADPWSTSCRTIR